MNNLFGCKTIAGLALTALLASQAWAGTVSTYQVTWDISAVGKGLFERTPSGTQYFFGAQLTNGGGALMSTKLKFDQFQLGGGMALMAEQFGGATGGMESALMLTDDDFFNGHLQEFKPGNVLNFRLRVEVENDGGIFPDGFSFGLYLLDDYGMGVIPTGDTLGADVFARADLTTALPQFTTFPSVVSQVDGMTQIPAPVFQLMNSTATPEPATLALFAAGLVLVLVRRPRARF